MHYIIARRRNNLVVATFVALASALLLTVCLGGVSHAQSGIVAATVCQPASQVTLDQPVSDSTVSTSPVTLAGTVIQANQLEVYVDDNFDSIISLNTAQTSYTGSVQLAAGTHTIKVVAVNICPGPNGSASSIVTFVPPPNNEGTGPGSDVETNTDTQEKPVSTEKDALPLLSFVPKAAVQAFDSIGSWLNIVATYEAPASSKLTLARATTIAIGSWLLAFGIATTVVQWLGSVMPGLSKMPSTRRAKIVGRGIRGVGLLMVLGGLFL